MFVSAATLHRTTVPVVTTHDPFEDAIVAAKVVQTLQDAGEIPDPLTTKIEWRRGWEGKDPDPVTDMRFVISMGTPGVTEDRYVPGEYSRLPIIDIGQSVWVIANERLSCFENANSCEDEKGLPAVTTLSLL